MPLVTRLLTELLDLHRSGRPDLFAESSVSKGKYTPEEYAELLCDPNAVIFIAEDGGEAAGYLICKTVTKRDSPILKDIRTLYLDDLCVDPSHRKRGLGRALMTAAEEYARAAGFHNITLNVWEFNESARSFYESLGYGVQRREMEKVLKKDV